MDDAFAALGDGFKELFVVVFEAERFPMLLLDAGVRTDAGGVERLVRSGGFVLVEDLLFDSIPFDCEDGFWTVAGAEGAGVSGCGEGVMGR